MAQSLGAQILSTHRRDQSIAKPAIYCGQAFAGNRNTSVAPWWIRACILFDSFRFTPTPMTAAEWTSISAVQFDEYARKLAEIEHDVVGPLKYCAFDSAGFERAHDRHSNRKTQAGKEACALLKLPQYRKSQGCRPSPNAIVVPAVPVRWFAIRPQPHEYRLCWRFIPPEASWSKKVLVDSDDIHNFKVEISAPRSPRCFRIISRSSHCTGSSRR